VCFLFLDPQDEVGPSISSSVVLCSFVILVYTVVLVSVVCLFPSSVRVDMSGNILWIICAFFCMLPFRIHEQSLNADAPDYGNCEAILRFEKF